MLTFDKHPNRFRLVFGFLASYLFVLAAVTVYQVASRPTDENLFTNPQSSLYVAKNFPAITPPDNQARFKNILLGDLIVGVNGRSVMNSSELLMALAASQDSSVEVVAFRFSANEKQMSRATRRILTGDYVRDIGPSARVIEVTEGGASDRAAMKVGDLILRINGKSFKNSSEADQILAEGQVGKELVYDVLRDNNVMSLQVTIASIGVPFPVLVSTGCGLLFFAVGIFLALARPRYAAARLSALSSLAFGYFIMVFLIRRGYVPSTFDKIRDLTMVLAVFLAMPLSIHAGHYFPAERPEQLSKKWIRRVPYGLALLGILATALLGNAGFFGTLIVMVSYSVIITLVFRKKASDEFKRLNRVIKNASITAGVACGAIGLFLINRLRSSQDIGYIMLPLILIPLAHLYTIGRYRLMGLDLRIRRNAQYILVTACWVVVVGVLAFRVLYWLQGTTLPIPNIHLTATSVEVLNSPLQPEQRIWLEKGILMLLSVIVVFTAWKIAQRGQSLIDTLYFRSQYDYRRAANELAEVMATKLNMVDLARGMVEKLSGLLQLKRVGVLFFRDQCDCCCNEVHGFDGSAWGQFCMENSRELADALQQLEMESSVDTLPEKLRSEFKRNGFLFIASIRSKDKLVGALLVGEKRSEATFQQEDLDFLGVVAKQASIAIENAFLYEELAEQERLKHELAIARRIQLASLPQTTPKITGLDIAGASHPALEVGGDYFDYLNGEPGKITIIVGDVSGKGTSAALYMSKVQGILRSLNAFKLSPKELFVRTNKLLCNDLEKSSFVTAITGAFEPPAGKLVIARAGHLPLYHYVAKKGVVEILTPKGLGLGLESTDLFSSELEERVIHYQANDVFVFASDGVTEAENISGGQLGEEGLLALIARYSSEDANSILNRIMEAVKEFAQGGEQHDDQTLVVVKTS
jgi:serine phosphatase RsbU (regulator of sigma subunit)